MEWINVLAILLSPLIAVMITLWYQNRSEKIKAKKTLFLTLMKHRQSINIPLEYVESLNTIDVVFQDNQLVIDLWAQYYDSLSSETPNLVQQGHLKIDLLAAMAKDLNYDSLKQTQIDRYYEPRLYHNQIERQQQISDELLRTLKNSEHYGAARITDDNKNE